MFFVNILFKFCEIRWFVRVDIFLVVIGKYVVILFLFEDVRNESIVFDVWMKVIVFINMMEKSIFIVVIVVV